MSEGPSDRDDAPEIVRPQAVVLGAESLIPAEHLIEPPPNRFTHTLVVDQPYHFDRGSGDDVGILAAGTSVLLISQGRASSRVADGTGLYVEVPNASLRPLGT